MMEVNEEKKVSLRAIEDRINGWEGRINTFFTTAFSDPTNRKNKIVIIAIVAAVVLAGIVFSIRPQATQIERVAKSCGVEYAVKEEGRSILLDTQGEMESYGDHPYSLRCVLDGLGAPPYIWERMLSTYSSEPPQTATWGRYTVAWVYRMDTGMRMSLSHN